MEILTNNIADNKKYFNRKIYTLNTLLKDVKDLLSNAKSFVYAKKNNLVSKSFREKIMLVTTAVNGCVYCAWYHAILSVKSGINREEINKLLKLQFNTDADDYETIALLYAQHYAETSRKPEKEMTEKLYSFYGNEIAQAIILYIKAIYFGNLSGNTFDAFLYRLKGIKAPNSNVLFEFVFFILSAPILLPTLPKVRKYRK
ncbi:MAG: carboxymuconolactone decarboxylase family protein [Bacteroidales bacterium]|nr:carboxymuconolactone decarboxylase family protein [Bacteroidales bacterium]